MPQEGEVTHRFSFRARCFSSILGGEEGIRCPIRFVVACSDRWFGFGNPGHAVVGAQHLAVDPRAIRTGRGRPPTSPLVAGETPRVLSLDCHAAYYQNIETMQ